MIVFFIFTIFRYIFVIAFLQLIPSDAIASIVTSLEQQARIPPTDSADFEVGVSSSILQLYRFLMISGYMKLPPSPFKEVASATQNVKVVNLERNDVSAKASQKSNINPQLVSNGGQNGTNSIKTINSDASMTHPQKSIILPESVDNSIRKSASPTNAIAAKTVISETSINTTLNASVGSSVNKSIAAVDKSDTTHRATKKHVVIIEPVVEAIKKIEKVDSAEIAKAHKEAPVAVGDAPLPKRAGRRGAESAVPDMSKVSSTSETTLTPVASSVVSASPPISSVPSAPGKTQIDLNPRSARVLDSSSNSRVCFDFQRGECRFQNCKFLHVSSDTAVNRTDKGSLRKRDSSGGYYANSAGGSRVFVSSTSSLTNVEILSSTLALGAVAISKNADTLKSAPSNQVSASSTHAFVSGNVSVLSAITGVSVATGAAAAPLGRLSNAGTSSQRLKSANHSVWNKIDSGNKTLLDIQV
jgi:hypothetical protein